jgi:hypothetical protein
MVGSITNVVLSSKRNSVSSYDDDSDNSSDNENQLQSQYSN